MINGKIYKIDYDRLVVWLLPTKERDILNVVWLRVLLAPLKRIYQEFLKFRITSNYKLTHNSQVASIEEVLNDLFDDNLKRIIIRNSEVKEPVWFYEPEDNKPVWFYEPEDNKPVYFYEESHLFGFTADFIVIVPLDLQPDDNIEKEQFELELRREINYYKLYSKNYTIVYE